MNRSAFALHRLAILVFTWLLLAGTGFAALFYYGATPGSGAAELVPCQKAPELRWMTKGKTLVMFAHPQCGCTRAGINELASVLARCEDVSAVNVVFVASREDAAAWNNAPLVRLASELPGAHVVWDLDGKVAEQFQAQTSGWTMLFDEQGRTLFQGGVTASRGHEGFNAGSALLYDCLVERTHDGAAHPVFGCPLFDDAANGRRGGDSSQ